MKTYWGSGGIASYILDLTTKKEVIGQLHVLAASPPRSEPPVPTVLEFWRAPVPDEMQWRKEKFSSLPLLGIEPRSFSP
jgi:hypothetical protein